MNLDLLLPFAKAHAVQSVALAAEWQGEVSDQTLLRIHSLAKKFGSQLPKVELQKMMQINLIPNPHHAPQTFPALGAVVFQKTTELGAVAQQFVVSRANTALIINDYTRWAPALQLAMTVYAEALPIILADKAVNAIALQYTDAFTWKDDPELLDLSQVFRPGSKYIPANAFDQLGAWHSHHGYVEDGSHPAEKERLNNININVADVAGERTIQITTVHRAALDKPLRASNNKYLELVESLQNKLHIANKDILAQILSDAVAEKIKLK